MYTRFFDIYQIPRVREPLVAVRLNSQMILIALRSLSLSSLGDDHSGHATLCTYDHAPTITLWVDKITVTLNESTFLGLATWWTMRLRLHCTFFVDQIRQCVCDIVVPRAAVRNTAYGKPRGVTTTLTEIIQEAAWTTTIYEPNNRQTKIIPTDILDKIRENRKQKEKWQKHRTRENNKKSMWTKLQKK